jgi:hypothetical protein
MKNIAHGVIEISVGDTEEEEKDVRALTDIRGDLSVPVEVKKITKAQEITEFLQSMEENINRLKR